MSAAGCAEVEKKENDVAVLLLASACRLNQLLTSSKSPASVPVWVVMWELLHKQASLEGGSLLLLLV